MKINILIPVYNDWKSASKLIEEINTIVKDLDAEFSLVIVNDASTEEKPTTISSTENLSYHINSRPIWKGLVTKEKLNSFEKYMCIDKICVGS